VKFARLGAIPAIAVALLACSGQGTREITGPVLDVDARSLTEVVSFTVKSGDDRLEIFVDPDADYAFPPQHLHEHVISGEPVRVDVTESGNRLIAVTLDDA
jgi:hypothetical protein